MENNNDIDKIYDALVRLNKKVSELEQRDMEIESILSNLNLSPKKEDEYILDQENTIVDSYNLSGHKSVSMPNGGVIRMKSKSFCVNGRHVVDKMEDVVFCYKCNSIICKEHYLTLDDEPACTNCLRDEIKDLDELDLYVLAALSRNFSLYRLKRALTIGNKELKSTLSKLLESKYVKQNITFSYKITLYGRRVVGIAEHLYDFSFMDDIKQTTNFADGNASQ